MTDRGAHLLPLTAPFREMNDWDGAWRDWVRASCLRFSHPWHVAPVDDCSCGFYAMKREEDVESGPLPMHLLVSLGMGMGTAGTVLGRVELAGKVIEHDLAYRAERARIVELIASPGTERSIMVLAARLDLPIAPPMAAGGATPAPA
jgi:hypothetical protein